jgi:hypothetical protein
MEEINAGIERTQRRLRGIVLLRQSPRRHAG